jgi:tetratricopeptide (TPR) repeat protein
VGAARAAERLNPYALAPLHLQAGGLEAQGLDDEARAVLREALQLEPRSFVTLTLMGDLEFRAGRQEAARGLYRRALERNPLDVGLQQLAAQP